MLSENVRLGPRASISFQRHSVASSNELSCLGRCLWRPHRNGKGGWTSATRAAGKLCGEYQFLTLACVDTAQCATPLRVLSVADFDEYYCIAVKHDQIKLAAFAQPVLRQQAQPLLFKMPERLGFGILTALLA